MQSRALLSVKRVNLLWTVLKNYTTTYCRRQSLAVAQASNYCSTAGLLWGRVGTLLAIRRANVVMTYCERKVEKI